MKPLMFSALAAACFALPASAEILISDAYARASGMSAKAGAAFMTITNTGDTDDRLLSVASDAAKRTEIHTHKETGDGIMKMVEVEGGLPIPAGAAHGLARGGDHIMFMGITEPFEQGKIIAVEMTFEKAGVMRVEIPVDLTR